MILKETILQNDSLGRSTNSLEYDDCDLLSFDDLTSVSEMFPFSKKLWPVDTLNSIFYNSLTSIYRRSRFLYLEEFPVLYDNLYDRKHLDPYFNCALEYCHTLKNCGFSELPEDDGERSPYFFTRMYLKDLVNLTEL
jgi:hypothetical protein